MTHLLESRVPFNFFLASLLVLGIIAPVDYHLVTVVTLFALVGGAWGLMSSPGGIARLLNSSSHQGDKYIYLTLFLWILLTGFISDWPQKAILSSFKFTGLSLSGITLVYFCSQTPLEQEKYKNFIQLVKLSFYILLVFLGIEFFGDGWLYLSINKLINRNVGWTPQKLDQSLMIVTMLLWPMVYLLNQSRQYVLMAVLIAFVVYLSLKINFYAVRGALVFGFICYGCCYWSPKNFIKVLGGASIIGFIVAPLIVYLLPSPEFFEPYMKTSGFYRLHIYKHIVQLISANPIIGYGMGSTGFLGCLPQPLPDFHCYLHPHNGALQLWLETGFIGLGLFAFSFWRSVCWISRIPSRAMVAAYGGLISSLLVFCNITISIWQSWWIGALFVVLAVLITIFKGTDISKSKGL